MVYLVGPTTLRLLWTYWDQLTMVAKSVGYFGHLFKVYQGVTQGDPLSPTIFNVVMDAFILHWVTVVTPTYVGMGGPGTTIIDLVEYFYSKNGLMVSTQPERLQMDFDVLTGLFDRVVLLTNTSKTVGMVC